MTTPECLPPEPSGRRVAWLGAAVTAGASGLGLLWGVDFALSVLAGGLLALVHFSALSWMVERIAQPRRKRVSRLAILGFALRYALLGFALYVIFAVWNLNVVAVSLGLSAPVAAIFFEWGLEAYQGHVQG